MKSNLEEIGDAYVHDVEYGLKALIMGSYVYIVEEGVDK